MFSFQTCDLWNQCITPFKRSPKYESILVTFGNPGLGPTTHLLAPYYKTSWEPSLPAAELCESAACESCDDQLGTCSLASQFPSERSTNNNKLDMYFWKKIKKNQKSTDEIGLQLLNHGVRHALRARDVLPISCAKVVLERATQNSKTQWVLLLKFQTRWNSSSMVCVFEKLRLDWTWNTWNIWAETRQNCL